MNSDILLNIKNLRKYYPITSGLFSQRVGDVKAVDGVSFQVNAREILGLVGESGCGKSTLGRTLLMLEKPTSGEIYYRGTDITSVDKNTLRKLRKEMQIVFQDPEASLDPRMTVGDSIGEGLIIHGVSNDNERMRRIAESLEQVGLEANQADLYPHEFSGGQKQRVGIARALAINPTLIIADEPVSALDVSIQAQILNLMLDIQQKLQLSYIFIAHDLAVIRYMANRVAVMYLGKIVEMAKTRELFLNALHPYTEALLSAVPTLQCKKTQKILLQGDVPSPVAPPSGCRFHTRCHRAIPVCSNAEPELIEITAGHLVACHLQQ
jgi:oligopeptide transport system ATP-binding protein